jgi:hypothetical protein
MRNAIKGLKKRPQSIYKKPRCQVVCRKIMIARCTFPQRTNQKNSHSNLKQTKLLLRNSFKKCKENSKKNFTARNLRWQWLSLILQNLRKQRSDLFKETTSMRKHRLLINLRLLIRQSVLPLPLNSQWNSRAQHARWNLARLAADKKLKTIKKKKSLSERKTSNVKINKNE